MSEIRTTPEAIQSLDTAFGKWASQTTGLWIQVSSRLQSINEDLKGLHTQRLRKVSAMEALLSAAPSNANLWRLHLEAVESLGRIRAAITSFNEIDQRARRTNRLVTTAAEFEVPKARADLRRRLTAIAAYQGSDTGPTGVPAPDRSRPPRNADLPNCEGLTMVDISQVDFSENPIVGNFGRGGVERADYSWAVETWESVVRPGVEKGLTRDDFATRDSERAAAPLRRTTDVYDLFLGDTAHIRLSRRRDGTLNVIEGRHRIQIARDLGIDRLPAEIHE
jgi:hypothetical protein